MRTVWKTFICVENNLDWIVRMLSRSFQVYDIAASLIINLYTIINLNKILSQIKSFVNFVKKPQNSFIWDSSPFLCPPKIFTSP